MASLNKVLLIGNLGRDPEMRYMPDGSAVCNFSIATTETWKDKNSGQKQEKTEWHNIVIYRQLAEVAGKYLKKGSSVYLEGRLQTRKWQDKTTGADRYTTEIIADQMKMLGGKGDAQPEDQQQSAPAAQQRQPAAQQKPSPGKFEDFDDMSDDIPF